MSGLTVGMGQMGSVEQRGETGLLPYGFSAQAGAWVQAVLSSRRGTGS